MVKRLPGPAYYWMVTFQKLEDKDWPSSDKMKEFFNKIDCKRYAFQEEAGEAGRLHYQCNFQLNECHDGKWIKSRVHSYLKKYDAKGFCCYLAHAVRPNKAELYCIKSDGTRTAGPWIFPPGQYAGEESIPLDKFYSWQKDLWDYTQHPNISGPDGRANSREIIWIRETIGNTGKTTFRKQLCFLKLAELIMPGLSAAQVMAGIVNDQEGQKLYLFDFPRTMSDSNLQQMLYVLEGVKNGHISTKWGGTSKQIFFKCPTVVVFSNWWPANLGTLSQDRWTFLDIVRRNGNLSFEQVPYFELARSKVKLKQESVNSDTAKSNTN
jgi:hypothetical protein